MFIRLGLASFAVCFFVLGRPVVESGGTMFGAPLERVAADFLRVVKTNGRSDTTAGTLYSWAQDTLLVEVTFPLSQWMHFAGNHLFLYYPQERQAFDIRATNVVTLPFFQSFVASTRDDFGLGQAGFTLSETVHIGETLRFVWKPPILLKKLLGYVTVDLVADCLVRIEAQDSQGGRLSETFYSEYIYMDGRCFPSLIKAHQFKQPEPVIEEIRFTNIVPNPDFPARVREFRIPGDIPVEVMEW